MVQVSKSPLLKAIIPMKLLEKKIVLRKVYFMTVYDKHCRVVGVWDGQALTYGENHGANWEINA